MTGPQLSGGSVIPGVRGRGPGLRGEPLESGGTCSWNRDTIPIAEGQCGEKRHYAAWLIAQGAHPRAMVERLGHSSVQVTLDRYGHLLPGLEEGVTAGLEEAFRAATAASPVPQP